MSAREECSTPEECDWRWVSDFEGDPGVINGTHDISHWECKTCCAEDWESEPPEDEYDPTDYF